VDIDELRNRASEPHMDSVEERIASSLEGIRYELAALVSIQRRQTSIHKTLIDSLNAELYEELRRDGDDDN
jgi:hypothetical protein